MLRRFFPPLKWTAVNSNNGPSWSRVINTGSFANPAAFGAVKFDFYNNPVVGDIDELFLPPMDLSGTGTPVLSFDLAKASRGSENDQLDILVSKDCGGNWTTVYSKAGSLLSTRAAITTPFEATLAQDWVTKTVSLNGFAEYEVLVKFRVTNDNGNNMYLDNINLSQPIPSGIREINNDDALVSLFPNPVANEITLEINSENIRPSTIKIMNSTGQLISEKQIELNSGINNFKMDTKEFSNGVYLVIVESAKKTITKKLVVSK